MNDPNTNNPRSRDADIGRALSDHDRRLVEELSEDVPVDLPNYQGIFSLMLGSFRSGFRPYFIAGVFMTLGVTAFCVYAIVQIFRSESTQHQILWSLAATASFVWVGLAKVWMWLQLERRAMLIELKRTELRVLSAIGAQR